MSAPRRWKPYPAYKDSGVEWLGEIPVGWEVKQLGKTIETLMDFRGRTPTKLGMDWGGAIPAVSAVNVREGYVDLSRGVNYGSQTLHDRWMAQGPTRKGDVLFTTEAPLGNVALVPDDNQYILSQRVVLLRPRTDQLMPEYLQRFLICSTFRQGVELKATGSTAEGIKRRHLMAMAVCLPQLREQPAIAAFLDRETGRIDGLVAKKERLIELLQEKRTALITRAVTKGLDPTVPMKDSGVEWLGEIPAHWEVKRLKHVAAGLGVGVVVNPSQYVVDDGLPFLYGSDVREGHVTTEGCRRISAADSMGLPKSRLLAGDLVMVRVGAPGVTAVVPPELEGANCASILVIRRSREVDSTWLCYALNSRYVRSQVAVVQYGAAQEQFNVSHAVDFLLAVPSPNEQRAIVALLDRETARLDALIAKIREAIERLKELRTALISAAVTGKIDVREEAA